MNSLKPPFKEFPASVGGFIIYYDYFRWNIPASFQQWAKALLQEVFDIKIYNNDGNFHKIGFLKRNTIF